MTNWHDEYKSLEQAWMVLKDDYSEVARALGFPGCGWWDDPLASHKEIVARAKELSAKRLHNSLLARSRSTE